MRSRTLTATLALILSLFHLCPHSTAFASSGTAKSESDGFSVKGWEDSAADRIPVEAVYKRQPHDDTSRDVLGVLHAVRRVPGATIVYASQAFSKEEKSWAKSGPSDDYLIDGLGTAYQWSTLYSSKSGRYWFPLRRGDEPTCLCPTDEITPLFRADVNSGDENEAGHELWTFAVAFPPLPEDVSEVSVSIAGDGKFILDVPVGSGALEPMVSPDQETKEQSFRYLHSFSKDQWPYVPDESFFADAVEPSLDDASSGDTELPLSGEAISYITGGAGSANRKASRDELEYTLSADVAFAFDSAEVSAEANEMLKKISEESKPKAKVVIQGHTDNEGSTDYNQQLSQKRAEAVANVLRNHFTGVEFEVNGFGEENPVADNDTEEGRAANRRVVVKIQ